MKIIIHLLCLAVLSTLFVSSRSLTASETEAKTNAETTQTMKPEVVLPEDEWKSRLTAEQFAVTRRAGTERPFGLAYENFEKEGEGTYYCVCCGGELFTSGEKFHSGCGWPSFYDASKANNVIERKDTSHGMLRVETLCKRCGAHLGHVFEGEAVSAQTPTKRRFCINAVALKFVPKGGKAPELLVVESDAVRAKKEEVAKEGGVQTSETK